MKKVISLFIAVVLCITGMTFSTTAYEEGDPCLTYGYDPAELDNYDTYGDDVFFRMNVPLKKPIGKINISFNRYATENIVKAGIEDGSLANILNENYFPEIEYEYIGCMLRYHEYFERNYEKYIYDVYPDYEYTLSCTLTLKDGSKEGVRKAVLALSERADIDIESVLFRSYDIQDVVLVLRHIADWEGYTLEDYLSLPELERLQFVCADVTGDGNLDLEDAAWILKFLAGWDVVQNGIFP